MPHSVVIRVITFEVVQPICPRYTSTSQTDSRTYGRTTYDNNTALDVAIGASRGKIV